jgi:adenylate cyclase
MSGIISNNLASKIKKIFWITFAWTLVSISQSFTGHFAILGFGHHELSGYDPLSFFLAGTFAGILSGLIGGSGVVFLWSGWLRSKNYGTSLLYIFLYFSTVYFFISVATGFFLFPITSGVEYSTLSKWDHFLFIFLDPFQVHNYLFWLAIALATFIVLLVNDKYGPGIFVEFLLGKYFHPKREERIFMFLDLRSSTTIAEQLGEERYFNFIKDIFTDATPGILNTKGEIYQYVGDEIVVSWRMDQGTENANCLKCFFEVQKELKKKAGYYQERYDGIQPVFKAGLHYGHVMSGEIGIVKRDIAFSGDVLNTASRIQDKCNEIGVNILLSQSLRDRILTQSSDFSPREIGDISLRGKQEKMLLYTV